LIKEIIIGTIVSIAEIPIINTAKKSIVLVIIEIIFEILKKY